MNRIYEQQAANSRRATFSTRYNSAVGNLLLVVVFTVVNLVLLLVQSGTYFLFSAFVPYFLTTEGMLLTGRFSEEFLGEELWMPAVMDDGFFWAMLVASAVIVVLYLVSFLLAKKQKIGWLIFALVFFALDTLAMLALGGLEADMLIDVAFHAWVIVSLSMGIHAHFALKKLPPEVVTPPTFDPATQTQPTPPSYAPATQAQPMTDTPALRRADTEGKSRVLVEGEIPGYHIVFRRVKKTNELVVNGTVYAEYVAAIERSHELYAFVGGHHILANYNGVSACTLVVDGQKIATKIRWI